MLSKVFRISVFTTVFVMRLMSEVNGQSENEKKSLKGITKLAVLVEYIFPEIERDVIKRSTIQTEVELKLRMAGIKVIKPLDNNFIEGNPYIHVYPHILKLDEVHYAFKNSVELKQSVKIFRNDEFITATTWENGSLGLAAKPQLNVIRDNIKDLVDVFINDYLEMNPKSR